MRELFSVRFWATIGALLAVVLLLTKVLPDGQVAGESSTAPGVVHRRIDLVAPVFDVEPSAGFGVGPDGLTTADLALVLDAQRTMVVRAGTPGEVECAAALRPSAVTAGCTVVVDLLGDAVLWFSLLEGSDPASVTLPATVELLDDGHVVLANGWELRHAYKVERRCAEDTQSLRAFITRFGEYASTTFDLESQRVVRVTCLGEPPETTASTVVPTSGGSTTTGG
ncbi:MAG: hypothetical protein ACO3C1_00605 [Ilumatobacteraceae bacterium]